MTATAIPFEPVLAMISETRASMAFAVGSACATPAIGERSTARRKIESAASFFENTSPSAAFVYAYPALSGLRVTQALPLRGQAKKGAARHHGARSQDLEESCFLGKFYLVDVNIS